MPNVSDFLFSATNIIPNTWVQLTNNATGVAYVSSAASNPNGLFPMGIIPAGTYTVATGPTNIGPWTTTGDANYNVANTVPVFNVMDYGAKGNGVVDDTAAFQLAINAAHAQSVGGTVLIPTFNYNIGSALTTFSNVLFKTDGATFTGAGASSVTPLFTVSLVGGLTVPGMGIINKELAITAAAGTPISPLSGAPLVVTNVVPDTRHGTTNDLVSGRATEIRSASKDGYWGINLNTPTADVGTTAAAAITFDVAGSHVWSSGLDPGTGQDWVGLFYWPSPGPGNVIEVSGDGQGKLLIGNGVGAPQNLTSQVFVQAAGLFNPTADIDILGGNVKSNSSRGIVLTQANSAGAAGAVKVELNSNIATARWEVYNSVHATRATSSWIYVQGNNPLVLGVNNAAVMRILGTTISVGGASITTHGAEQTGLGLEVLDNDFAVRSTGASTTSRVITLYPAWGADATNKLTIQASTGDKSIISSSRLVLTGTSINIQSTNASAVAENSELTVTGNTLTLTNGYSTNRSAVFSPQTLNGAFTIANAATVAITAAPSGTATITNPYALWVQAGLTELDGGLTVTGGTTTTNALTVASGVLTLPAGAVGATAINFGNVNSGIYASGNQVRIANSGVDTLITRTGVTGGTKFSVSNITVGSVVAETPSLSSLGDTLTVTTGYATQRSNIFAAPTINGPGQTITSAATLAVTGAPSGTATLTNTYALWAQAGISKFDGPFVGASVADTFSGAITITVDGTKPNTHTIACTSNTASTLTPSGAGYAGQHLWILLTADGTGGNVITFASTFKSSGTLTTTASKGHTIHFVSNGTNWYEVARTLAL